MAPALVAAAYGRRGTGKAPASDRVQRGGQQMSAKRYGSDPRSLGAVVSRRLPHAARVAFWFARMERDWAEVVDERFARSCRPLRLEGSVLIVACESPAMANLMNLSAGTWLYRIKKLYGVDLSDLRAVVRRLPRERKISPPRARAMKVPKKAVEEAYARISPQFKDKNTALALARLEAAAKTRWGEGKKSAADGG